MNIEQLRDYCLQKKLATESFPFDNETLVFKVMNKIFALIPLEKIPPRINLKMDPELVPTWREQNEGVLAGYHMNKKMWNTIMVDQLSKKDLIWLIDHSYDEVVKKISKKEKEKYSFL
jgi:predicted DNA-binding protein (MmcQ/YjbR family)